MATVYLLLGAPASLVAELAHFLQREAFDRETRVQLLASEDHRAHLGEADTIRYFPSDEALPPVEGSEEHWMLLPSPHRDPRPFLEKLREWLEVRNHDLGRILTVVDCAALAADPSLMNYYDLCLHFSDVFLLGNRQDVSKKWIQEYQNRLHKLAVPTLVELLKKGGRVNDAPGLLYPEARRLSQFFDPPEEEVALPFEIEGFGAEEASEDLRDAEDDPYLARGEDGQYLKRVKV